MAFAQWIARPGAIVGVLALALCTVAPRAAAEAPPLPAFEVPMGALAVADYWVVGEVTADEGGPILVRVMRLRVGNDPVEFSVELQLPAPEPDGFQSLAIVPEDELPGLVQALNAMLSPPRRPDGDGRDETVLAYSPVPDLVITLSLRAGALQRVGVFIQGEAVTLRGDRSLMGLRDVLVRAQGRIRELRQRP